MKLSIIVPTYNEEENIVYLINNIKSICNVEYETIVVDGGSTDKTISLVNSFANSAVNTMAVNIILTEKGRATQQNAGAKIAKGQYLLFLHADSLLSKNFDIDIINLDTKSAWGRFDVKLSGKKKIFRLIEFMMNLRSRLTHIATGDQGIFVTKKLFEKIGGFADLSLMEDIELCSRLKNRVKPYNSKIKIITSSRKWEKNGVFKTVVLMWWFRLQFYFCVDSKIIENKYYKNPS